MGYELRVTRGAGRTITTQEWCDYVAHDPEFEQTGRAEAATPEGALQYVNAGLSRWLGHPAGTAVWFDLRQGEVFVNTPDPPILAKMSSVAAALGASVVGDDGENYATAGDRPQAPRAGWKSRLRRWFGHAVPPKPDEPPPAPFAVGARVRNPFGAQGTVVRVDARANHGLGSVVVRFDDDREISFAALAHGLEEIRGHDT